MSFSVPLVSLIRDRGAAEKKITNRSRAYQVEETCRGEGGPLRPLCWR
jgi:hypothetical protein